MSSSALLLLKLALLAAYTQLVTAKPTSAPECNTKCGKVDVPSPFGMTKNCFRDPDFEIICKHSIPYLARNKTFQILSISGDSSEIHVSMPVIQTCYDPKRDNGTIYLSDESFCVPSKFSISNKKNKFIVVGPDIIGYLRDRKERRIHGCETQCGEGQRSGAMNYSGYCSGDVSCQHDFEQALTNYSIFVSPFFDDPELLEDRHYVYAFLAQNGSFNISNNNDVKIQEAKGK